MAIEQFDLYGETAIRVQNEEMEFILVPAWGSNLLSLRLKSKNLELLRFPKSRELYQADPILYGLPILFPPNRIADGTFDFNGKKYCFNINDPLEHNHTHGLLFDAPWTFLRAEAEGERIVLETIIHSEEHEEIMAQFPHLFTVHMHYILEQTTLTIEATISSRDTAPFPWGLGYHTTFNYPFNGSGDHSLCRFSLNADKQWVLDERFLPTGELVDIPYLEQLQEGKSLVGHALDDAFQTAKTGANEAVLTDRGSGICVVYSGDEYFKHWVIYNDDSKQGYLCPEPYTWITNAPNLQLPEELTGFRVLQPGEQVKTTTRIVIEEVV
ncbi:aldose 1-epimerase [Paenibacillus baekrokdamisoli]|uniref:Aldose 1-epimerase n=1 Tax=Paenibacillus baekrokdamisoli TaxID=1712516 RepID=A0A3G9ILQ7_9BACL|nr:aldose 1-epimerase [Paenibacillus baekrokdamisoli]MBB3067672.1 aldose 1-epimerase [Paenibacillus baekrokdamisoli]BBH19142.1 aldose 1-epimerase [Paenibacillus baekrokdamisoli]